MNELFASPELKLNVDKTKSMSFCNANETTSIVTDLMFINIDEMNVGFVENMKYL